MVYQIIIIIKKKVFLFKTILAIIVVGFPFILFSICFNIMYKICLTSMGLLLATVCLHYAKATFTSGFEYYFHHCTCGDDHINVIKCSTDKSHESWLFFFCDLLPYS